MGKETTEETSGDHVAVLMFTDIVDSVEIQNRVGTKDYVKLLEQHDRLFREALSTIPNSDQYQDTGDGHLARFRTASDAVNAALQFQSLIREADWPQAEIRVRIGLHQGQVTEIETGRTDTTKTVGMPVNIAARIMGLAQGGQILLTRSIFDDARQFVRAHPTIEKPEEAAIEWKAHGKYLFKGGDESLEVFEVGLSKFSGFTPPVDSDKARRVVSKEEENTLGWRPGAGLPIPKRKGWKLIRKLGSGGFGEVWLGAHHKLKEERVFKFCFDANRLRSLKREVTLFRLIRHRLGRNGPRFSDHKLS